MFKWLEKPATVEEITLVAWHAMINDPYLTVYTMKQNKRGEWVEDRHFVNPKLAFNRMMNEMGLSFKRMGDQFREQLFPAITGMSRAFENFAEQLQEMGLNTSFPDDDGVELEL